MIENGKITPLQLGIAIFMFSLGSAALLSPSLIVSIAKQDAWMSVLLSNAASISFIYLWVQLLKRYPNESIVQFSGHIVGKWLGKLVGMVYLWYFIYLSALVLKNIGQFVTTNVLVQTPIQVVQIMFMIPVMYGAYMGLEVIARASEVLFPWVILIFLTTVLLLIKDIDLANLLPILPDGWQSPLKGLYPLLGFPISELVVFLTIFPFVNQPKKVRKYSTIFVSLTSLFGTLIVVILLSVLGVDLTTRSTFAVFDLAKEIRIGTFFERVEVLVGVIWVMTIFVKLVFCFYAANLATAQFFDLKSFRATILPFGILVVALSILVHPNPAAFYWYASGAAPLYSLIHGFLIPALLLLVAIIRGKR